MGERSEHTSEASSVSATGGERSELLECERSELLVGERSDFLEGKVSHAPNRRAIVQPLKDVV